MWNYSNFICCLFVAQIYQTFQFNIATDLIDMSKQRKCFNELSSWSRKRRLRESLGLDSRITENREQPVGDVESDSEEPQDLPSVQSNVQSRTHRRIINCSSININNNSSSSSCPTIKEGIKGNMHENAETVHDTTLSNQEPWLDNYCEDYYRLACDSSSGDSDSDDSDASLQLRHMIIDWAALFNISQNALTA